MELSVRLRAVADLITEGYRVADIGTDHGYLPIYLMNQKKSPCVIAMDINEGPLQTAREHIASQTKGNYIETRLSDGLKALHPGECDCIVAAGMGGGLVTNILSDHRDVTASLKECILQPQSEIAKVRAFLLMEGFSITKEDMVLDAGKYYPMMKVSVPADFAEPVREKKALTWTETELSYGKLLLEMRHPVLKQFLDREVEIKIQVLERLATQSGSHIEVRRREIENELALAREGLSYYSAGK
ncbi:MAG: class I SAM-dependent methyltransferase [Hespellia sp.]|nr:class I SAM-dependent methyltransferase [Hespellia sp.]